MSYDKNTIDPRNIHGASSNRELTPLAVRHRSIKKKKLSPLEVLKKIETTISSANKTKIAVTPDSSIAIIKLVKEDLSKLENITEADMLIILYYLFAYQAEVKTQAGFLSFLKSPKVTTIYLFQLPDIVKNVFSQRDQYFFKKNGAEIPFNQAASDQINQVIKDYMAMVVADKKLNTNFLTEVVENAPVFGGRLNETTTYYLVKIIILKTLNLDVNAITLFMGPEGLQSQYQIDDKTAEYVLLDGLHREIQKLEKQTISNSADIKPELVSDVAHSIQQGMVKESVITTVLLGSDNELKQACEIQEFASHAMVNDEEMNTRLVSNVVSSIQQQDAVKESVISAVFAGNASESKQDFAPNMGQGVKQDAIENNASAEPNNTDSFLQQPMPSAMVFTAEQLDNSTADVKEKELLPQITNDDNLTQQLPSFISTVQSELVSSYLIETSTMANKWEKIAEQSQLEESANDDNSHQNILPSSAITTDLKKKMQSWYQPLRDQLIKAKDEVELNMDLCGNEILVNLRNIIGFSNEKVNLINSIATNIETNLQSTSNYVYQIKQIAKKWYDNSFFHFFLPPVKRAYDKRCATITEAFDALEKIYCFKKDEQFGLCYDLLSAKFSLLESAKSIKSVNAILEDVATYTNWIKEQTKKAIPDSISLSSQKLTDHYILNREAIFEVLTSIVNGVNDVLKNKCKIALSHDKQDKEEKAEEKSQAHYEAVATSVDRTFEQRPYSSKRI